MLPSQEKGERLHSVLPEYEIRTFSDSGHSLLLVKSSLSLSLSLIFSVVMNILLEDCNTLRGIKELMVKEFKRLKSHVQKIKDFNE